MRARHAWAARTGESRFLTRETEETPGGEPTTACRAGGTPGPSRGPAPGRKGPPPLRGDQERGARPRHTAQELGANRSPNSWLFRHETL